MPCARMGIKGPLRRAAVCCAPLRQGSNEHHMHDINVYGEWPAATHRTAVVRLCHTPYMRVLPTNYLSPSLALTRAVGEDSPLFSATVRTIWYAQSRSILTEITHISSILS